MGGSLDALNPKPIAQPLSSTLCPHTLHPTLCNLHPNYILHPDPLNRNYVLTIPQSVRADADVRVPVGVRHDRLCVRILLSVSAPQHPQRGMSFFLLFLLLLRLIFSFSLFSFLLLCLIFSVCV